ncbi:MAG: glycosyl hydrolase 115 family protein [Prevotella sp.]|nr:glycosyl hydrolase 115 family protein [Prevotella sp.]
MKRILTLSIAMFMIIMNMMAQETFCIAKDGKTAAIVVDEQDWTGVVRAARDLSDDVGKVCGTAADLTMYNGKLIMDNDSRIVVGTIGKSRIIDKLVKQKKLDVNKVRGQWESFVIDVVDGNLIVAGSDKRGTIYGIYEISQRIGVSPWYWWADVPVKHQTQVYWNGGRFVSQEPTVKYRGIFINDEDWGLKPWSSKNFEKELGDIGPKTYARVCELLLRLRANMLAPAMHSCTGAFYSHPESKVVADSFGIIITTSHCEPLLLNNAAKSEWDSNRDGDWNYKTNRETIWKKWDNRLSEASQYENIYTVAMRGVHDAGLRGNLPMEERVPLIEQVIKEQRDLLVKHQAYSPSFKGKPKATDIPQIFVPYKETMDIYENGLQVPDDITLVWVDDNYGYLKRVSNPEEQQRSGRAGVYYHLSYLGAPHDYLWLNTTPPVLMYEELKKAYDTGADRYWLLNVGDIKPMELGIQTFMDMAWNIKAFDFESVNRHQSKMLASLFGKEHEQTFLSILNDYYRLAWSRKPEFMGWEYEWDDKAHTGLKPTEFSFQNYADAQQRLLDYERLSSLVGKLSNGSAAYYELLQFPIQAAYQMNRKFLMAQLNQELAAEGRLAEANWAASQMEAAYDSINALNRHYNEQHGGKWRGMMDLTPGWCALYHKKPEVTYTKGVGTRPVDLTPKYEPLQDCYVLNLANYDSKSSNARFVNGLGYDWQVLQLGTATYSFPAVSRDTIEVTVYTVPFWPLYAGKSNAISIVVDDGKPQVFENKFEEYSRSWKDQVMRNGAVCRLRFAVEKSRYSHTIRFIAKEPGQMLQRVIIDWGGLKSTYIGPSVALASTGVSAAKEKAAMANPVIFADVPDLDIIRVDDTYYMVSTTMHFAPGCGIMKSKDLVNWEIINYAYDEIDEGDRSAFGRSAYAEKFRLLNGQSDYSQGSWAANLRYDPYEKMFYMIMTCNTTGKTYFYVTDDIEHGKWHCSTTDKCYDPGLLFEDTGSGMKKYVLHPADTFSDNAMYLREISVDKDWNVTVSPREKVLDYANLEKPARGLRAEGYHGYKIGDYYYIFMIQGCDGQRQEIVWRTKDLKSGQWESHMVFGGEMIDEQGNVVMQTNGIGQGGIVQTPDGQWWCFLFKDYGSVGRMPIWLPMTWSADSWPIVGNGSTDQLPAGRNMTTPYRVDLPASKGMNIVQSDEFNVWKPKKSKSRFGSWKPGLKLCWQWNHIPDNSGWSLTERKGWLRLKTTALAHNIRDARNSLTQRTFGPTCSGQTLVDVSKMKDGDWAGLASFQRRYGFVGVKKENGQLQLVMRRAMSRDDANGQDIETKPLNQTKVWLRVDHDFRDRTDKAHFFYSLDSKDWQPIGDTLQMHYDMPDFCGQRFMLFNFATQQTGGIVDFDFFHVK